MEQQKTSFLYDTVGLLSAEPVPDPIESYSVFRNRVSESVWNFPEISPEDYFSLEPPRTLSPSPSSPPPSKPGPSQEDPYSERAWFRPNSLFKSPMLQLHKEILDFCDFISPTQEEQASRATAVQSVIDVIKYIWPHCRVEVFGSFKTGLYLPTSDIDVVILDSNVRTPQIGLHALSKALKQRNVGKKIVVIAKARVPIIKFVEMTSGVAFDISFDLMNGPKAADFIKDVVTKIPPLRPLCLILKVFLQQRELNEVYSGGVGSYALLVMLLAHLQAHWRGQDFEGCQTLSEHNLGILLVKFFELYGRKLNTWDVGVSCNATSTFFSKCNKGFLMAKRPYLLSIEDPQASDNDIGKNSFNYFQIRSAFAMAYSLLTNAKTISALGPNRSILGTIIRPDPLLMKRKGGYNGEMTFDRLLPGAGEPLEREFRNDFDAMCNWDLFDDEPLPRENGIVEDEHTKSSRKRKSLKAKCGDGVASECGETPKSRRSESSSRKEKAEKRGKDGASRRWRR